VIADTTPVDCLQSARLHAAGFRHAFFTRHGGVSAGPYATLNFSRSVGDRAAHVERNLCRAAATLRVPPARLYVVAQVHGADVVEITAADTPEAVARRPGDALIARADGLACGVRVADCVPVLLADRASGAVAAVHAGWRGVVADVVGAAVAALRAGAPGEPDLVAAIGPHISAAAFEVGEDVATALGAVAPGVPAVRQSPGGRPCVDLRALVRAELVRAGVPMAAIDDVAGCTFSEPDRFFSFRRDGAHSGRHLAAIVARAG